MENFIVSARKYRPATFASVVGQNHITSTLKNAIERGQLAHAYLFCGPRGVGKTTCARIFAKTINCLSPVDNEPCGVCESCLSFEQNRSLNIHELDAASNNSVEDIRSLIEQVRIIPQLGKYSLFIIDEVHMLSTAAFNAFLKTLEEPPAHAIFILATTERHKILPTILSRCQCYDFNRIRVEDGAEYLRYIASKEGVTIDDESLNLIAQKADGGMRDALSMFDKAVSFGGTNLDYKVVAQSLGVVDYETYFRITDQLLKGDYPSALLTFDEVLSMGFGASAFLTGLARHLRDLLVAQSETTGGLLELTKDLMERYTRQGAECSVQFLFGAINILATTDGEMKRSSNQRLLVELGLMKISTLSQKKNIAEDSTLAESFERIPLPELQRQRAATAKPTVAPKPATVETPAPKVVNPEVAKVEAPKVEEKKVETEAAPTPKPQKSKASIFSLKGALSVDDMPTKKSETSSAERKIDPDAERKILSTKSVLMKRLEERRPRFVAFFENMQVVGSVIKLRVPSEDLKLEVLRSDTSILSFIVKNGDIDGVIEMEITVDPMVESKIIVKLDDRVKHFLKKNPALSELESMLDMQIDG